MKNYLCSMILICWIVVGCYSPQSQHENLPPLPDIDVAPNTLNDDLDVFATESRNTFETNDNIILDVHLKTNIKIKGDFVIEMFALDEEGARWIKVSNFEKTLPSITFLGDDNIILNAQNPNLTLVVHPVFSEGIEEIKLLIMIKGIRLDEDQQRGYIGSYIILTLR